MLNFSRIWCCHLWICPRNFSFFYKKTSIWHFLSLQPTKCFCNHPGQLHRWPGRKKCLQRLLILFILCVYYTCIVCTLLLYYGVYCLRLIVMYRNFIIVYTVCIFYFLAIFLCVWYTVCNKSATSLQQVCDKSKECRRHLQAWPCLQAMYRTPRLSHWHPILT